MGLQSLFVVNKAGSLIFYRKLSDDAPQLTQNDYLHLASTFHGYESHKRSSSCCRIAVELRTTDSIQ